MTEKTDKEILTKLRGASSAITQLIEKYDKMEKRQNEVSYQLKKIAGKVGEIAVEVYNASVSFPAELKRNEKDNFTLTPLSKVLQKLAYHLESGQ